MEPRSQGIACPRLVRALHVAVVDEEKLHATLDLVLAHFKANDEAAGLRRFLLREPGRVCRVTLADDALTIERPGGERTRTIVLADLESLYVESFGKMLSIVMLGYREGKRHKVERIDAYADAATRVFVDTLVRERPEIDCSKLDRRAAFARMGIRNTHLVGLLALTLVLVLGALGIANASIVRLVQRRSVITLSAGGRVPDGASYVTVDGAWPILDRVVSLRHGTGGSSYETDVFVPLVPMDVGCAASHVALRLPPGGERDPSLSHTFRFSGGRESDPGLVRATARSSFDALRRPHAAAAEDCVVRFEAPLVVLDPALTPASDALRVGLWVAAAIALSGVVAWATKRRRTRNETSVPAAGPYR